MQPAMTRQTASTLADLLDREAIRDCLITYARAIDRCDRKLLESVYWAEGRDNHVVFDGPASKFIEWVIPLLQTMEQTTHSLSNIFIDLRDEEAKTESQFCAFHRTRHEDRPVTFTLGGRYLDHMVKRSGEWRILQRTTVFDWMQEDHAPIIGAGNVLGVELRTNRYPDDPSYRLFGS
jgi:hypothetical protein